MTIRRFCQATITATLLSLACVSAVAVAAAYSPRQSSRAASSDALLSEVRALRADIQETAAATIRAHLLVGRLQLQEGRINSTAWQLAEARRLVTAYEAKKATPLASLKNAEDGIARGLQGFDKAIADARAELARIEQEEQPLRNQETQLANQLKSEQQHWMDFNSRLDELERTLPKSSSKKP